MSDEPFTVRSVLEAALTATRQDGGDWAARLKAAQLLLTHGDPDDANEDNELPRTVFVDAVRAVEEAHA